MSRNINVRLNDNFEEIFNNLKQSIIEESKNDLLYSESEITDSLVIRKAIIELALKYNLV